LNLLFPPDRIDFECRPYEFGWLLYAWLFRGVIPQPNAKRGLRHG
jgi:hypothetical protein